MILLKNREKNRLCNIPLAQIVLTEQGIRQNSDKHSLSVLADSIRQHGLLCPLVVRQTGSGEYELISGRRRLAALMLIGAVTVPCTVINTETPPAELLSLAENIHREELTVFEQAKAISHLIDNCGYTPAEIGAMFGFSQNTVKNKLNILKLTKIQQKQALFAGLSERQISNICKLQNPEKLQNALDYAVKHRLDFESADFLLCGNAETVRKFVINSGENTDDNGDIKPDIYADIKKTIYSQINKEINADNQATKTDVNVKSNADVAKPENKPQNGAEIKSEITELNIKDVSNCTANGEKKIISVFYEQKIIENTVERVVKTSRKNGINAKYLKTETADYTAFTVLIPKKQENQ